MNSSFAKKSIESVATQRVSFGENQKITLVRVCPLEKVESFYNCSRPVPLNFLIEKSKKISKMEKIFDDLFLMSGAGLTAWLVALYPQNFSYAIFAGVVTFLLRVEDEISEEIDFLELDDLDKNIYPLYDKILNQDLYSGPLVEDDQEIFILSELDQKLVNSLKYLIQER